MGRSIVYCDTCGQLLREGDFTQGRASTADNRSYCSTCRPTGSSPALPKPPASPRVSSTRIPKQPAHESRRMPAIPPPPAPSADESDKSKALLYIGGAAGVILLGVIFALMSGGDHPSRKADDLEQTVVSVKTPAIEAAPSEDRRREEAARQACMKAYEIQTSRPLDLAAQWKAFEAALALAQGTPFQSDPADQLAKLRRRFDDLRSAVEAQTQEAVSQERFQSVIEAWEAQKARYALPEWTDPVSRRIAEWKAEVERRLGNVRDSAVDAKRRGDLGETGRLRARVAAWGLTGYPEQLDQALAEVTVVKADPGADPAERPKGADPVRARWRDALAPAAARDYAEAQKALEKLALEAKEDAARKEAAEDLADLKLAASLVQEASALLSKLTKGQKVALAYWDPSGQPARVEDVVLKIDAQRVELKSGEDSVVVPFGEVRAATLGDLFKGRGSRKESDGRASALACLLEGDLEGAQRLGGGAAIPEKYAAYAKEVRDSRAQNERERAARTLFYEAEREYFDPGTSAVAAGKYRSLLADYALTAFVRRNRSAIAARTDAGPKDLLLTANELTASSGFKLGKHGKIEAAWVSLQDLDSARMKDNFVEWEFAAVPDQEYRTWILAGGCCQEVFSCFVQATELSGPDPANPKEKIPVEPGSGAGLPVRLPFLSLKKLHSQHNGPKTPEKFEWISLGVLKFPTAGVKKVRVLSNQKGFAVAMAAVLTTRPGPPRESELRDLEKWRAETPGATAGKGAAVTGSILREVWKGIQGGGVGDLLNAAAFKEDHPAERGMLSLFEGPTNVGFDYGTRIRGYVHPPASGAYVFWISTDDGGELRLSSDDDPAHAKPIAACPQWTSPREYGKFPEQQSQPVELKAGRRYYIEALHKQGVGGDHISVGWKLPNGTEEKPIPGTRLSPFVPVK